MHVALAPMGTQGLSAARTAGMLSPRRLHSCTIWTTCGANGKSPVRIWFSPRVSSTPTPPCTDRARLRVRRASCSIFAASTMPAVSAEARVSAERISSEYRVHIELALVTHSTPALLDTRLRSRLLGLLERPFEMASGAGHDAAVFSKVGIPSAMIFVRNEHGSHNPDEAMSLDDFAIGARALLQLLVDFPL